MKLGIIEPAQGWHTFAEDEDGLSEAEAFFLNVPYGALVRVREYSGSEDAAPSVSLCFVPGASPATFGLEEVGEGTDNINIQEASEILEDLQTEVSLWKNALSPDGKKARVVGLRDLASKLVRAFNG